MKNLRNILGLLLLSSTAFAQSPFAGNWEGKLNVGGASLRMVMHITEENGQLSAKMDSPDQGAFGIAVTSVSAKNDSLFVSIDPLKASYKGRLENDRITGSFQQGMMSLPVTLERGVKNIVRSQTPKPPFDYISEDVSYTNADKSIQYGATITIPKGKGPFSAVVLSTGSGPQNRDEELFGHKPFAVIADQLTKSGYIVLRADDRGVGKTTGTFSGSTTRDFADDAAAGIEYLKTRKEVNIKKIGVLGHSEGGLVAEMLAAQRKDIAFIVLMAAPGVKVPEMMAEQNKAVLMKAGLMKEAVDAYTALYIDIANDAVKVKDNAELKRAITARLKEWTTKTDPAIVAVTMQITDDATLDKAVDLLTATFSDKWTKYFFSQDPQLLLEKTKAKVLAINGSEDIQVISSMNLNGIKAALDKGKNKHYSIKELKGLNHLFQTCKTCTVGEYQELDETIAPEVLTTITEWMDANVK